MLDRATSHILVALFALVVPASAQALSITKVGMLACTTSDTPPRAQATADVSVSCHFTSESGQETNFNGFATRKNEADFPPGKRVLVWTVLAQSVEVDSADLAGQFAGSTGGENAGRLAGGFNNSIVLEPVTATSQIGGDEAPTVLHLRLEPTKV